MERVKALIAVIMFVATLLFAFNTKEARPENRKASLHKITPVQQQDSSYIHPVTIP
jgi:hypothetical protein